MLILYRFLQIFRIIRLICSHWYGFRAEDRRGDWYHRQPSDAKIIREHNHSSLQLWVTFIHDTHGAAFFHQQYELYDRDIIQAKEKVHTTISHRDMNNSSEILYHSIICKIGKQCPWYGHQLSFDRLLENLPR